MDKDIILVGAFHEVIELCEDCCYNIVGIIDNKLTGKYYNIPILGSDDDAGQIYQKYPLCKIVITPDFPFLRIKLSNYYAKIGFKFATIISPKATISRSATIGEGTIIQSGVNVSSATKIGRFVKLNTNSNVMHDNVVEDFSTIAPNAVLLGYVKIGRATYIGANSTILPHIMIGSSAIVGAGSVVTKNVTIQQVVKGVPAK